MLAILIATLCASPTCHAGGLVAAWGEGDYSQVLVPGSLNNVKALAAGGRHTLALKSDGTVVAWGANFTGQAAVPEGLAGIKAVAAGGSHSLGLRIDGRVVGWGYNGYGQTTIPSSASNVVAIAAGGNHSLALRADGTVVCWGDNNAGQSTPPTDVTNIVAIAAGETHSLALKADGTVVAWGWNWASIPPSATNIVAIAAGSSHSLALNTDGRIIAWGNNIYGQTTVPADATNVVAITAGNVHNLALRLDGSVVGWGNSFYGQATIPSVLTRATAIAAGGNASFAIVFDGPVQILQNPQSLTIQYPSTSNATLSVTASGAGPLTYRWFHDGYAVADGARVSGSTSAMLTISNAQPADTGTYTIAVSNAFGSVISSGAVLTVISPPFIISQSFTNLTVGAGADVTFSVLANGTPQLSYQWFLDETNLVSGCCSTFGLANVQASGLYHYSVLVTNIYGTARADFLLTVTNSPPYISRQPYIPVGPYTQANTATNGVALIGGSITIYMDARGSLPLSYQWRFNGVDIPNATNKMLVLSNLRFDQTGYYNVEVSNAFGTAISAKFFLNVVQVYVWGESVGGGTSLNTPTNVPPSLTNVIALAAGNYHLLALKSDGRVITWATFPVPASLTNIPPSATNVIAIAAAGDNSMVLRSNGTVVVWGNNSYSQTNVPASVSNIIAIATGGSHCLALRSNGTVVGWGNNSYGQAASPVGLSNVIAIAAGGAHSLALKADGSVIGWGYNAVGETIPPPGTSNVIAIDAAVSGSLALKASGTAVAWGSPSGSTPANLTNLVAIAEGYRHMGLKADGSVASWVSGQTLAVPTLSNVIALAVGERGSFSAAVIGGGSPFFTIQPASQITTRSNTVKLHARAVGVQPLNYQWQFENQNLPGATNADLTILNARGRDTGAYRCAATNSRGTNTSAVALVTIPYSVTLPAALNATNLTWTTNLQGSASPWFAQIRVTHDGDAAAQSGTISNNQQSTLQTTVTGPGTLTFWWKVSSEEGYDFLKFFADNTATPLASISGENDWEQKTFTIASGTHLVRWSYAKDATVSTGQDAGWLDEVVFTPSAPVIDRQPFSQTVPLGANVTIPAVASGPGPLIYQWLKNGTNLFGATAPYLTLTNVARRDSASYALRVSNPGGSVTSSNAALKVIVRQQLSGPRPMVDGSVELTSRDADGGSLLPQDFPAFEVLASTNLADWVTLPDVLSLTNGSLLLRDRDAGNLPRRFYRIVEH